MTYDFIDIGSSKGGSVRYCQKRFGEHGYGIDIAADKVAIAQADGYDVRLIDIQAVTDSARWVTIMHVIEHLSGREEAREMISKALEIATEGIYITYPCFDYDAQLMKLGLKFAYSDWDGHPYHCSTLEMHNILRDLGVHYKLEFFGEVLDSYSKHIIPLSAPKDSIKYDAETMAFKTYDTFKLYREVRFTINSKKWNH